MVGLATVALAACTDYEDRKQAYLDKGIGLFEAGDDARARLELKNVLQIDAKFAPGWYWLGRVEARSGDLRKAFGNYSRAVELDPGYVPALIQRGQIFVLAKDFEAAAKDAEAALALAPQDPDALMLRAALRKRNGDDAGAEADTNAALAASPGHPAASALLAVMRYERGEKEAAIAALEAGIAAHPEVPALQVLLARYHHETGNVQGAIDTLRALALANPGDAGYQNRLATYLVQQGREDEAEQALRAALAAAPEDFARQQALITLLGRRGGVDAALSEVAALREKNDSNALRFAEAGLLRAAQRAEPAEQTYRDIIEASGGQGPDAIKARNALAAMLAAERADEAAVLIAAVLEESPTEPDALQLRAALALRNGQPDQAIGDLRTVLSEYPDRVAAQRLIGQAHAAKGEAALAQDAFEQAVRMAPSDPTAYLQLAELRVRNGDNDGALLALEGLLEKVPDNEAAQQAIARIQFSSQDWKALGETAARIQETRPAHPLGYYLNGLVLQRQGDHAQAIKAFEQALEVSPKAIEPIIALARSQLALDRADLAEQRVREVLADNPNSIVALNLLGDIYAASDQTDKARAAYQETIRFHAKSPRAYRRLAQLEALQGDADAAVAVLERGADATQRNGILVFQLATTLERAGDFTRAAATYDEVLQRYPQADVAANNLAPAAGHQGR